MDNLGKHELRSVLIEMGCYSLLFGFALFFPMTEFSEHDDVKQLMIYKSNYLNDVRLSFAFPLCFVIVLLSFFSLKQSFIQLVCIFAIIAASLTFLLFMLGTTPMHGKGGSASLSLGGGFWLCNLALTLLIIRTFVWSHYRNIRMNKTLSFVCEKLVLVIPTALAVYFVCLGIYKATNSMQPAYRP